MQNKVLTSIRVQPRSLIHNSLPNCYFCSKICFNSWLINETKFAYQYRIIVLILSTVLVAPCWEDSDEEGNEMSWQINLKQLIKLHWEISCPRKMLDFYLIYTFRIYIGKSFECIIVVCLSLAAWILGHQVEIQGHLLRNIDLIIKHNDF
jgi:hypothetical protein